VSCFRCGKLLSAWDRGRRVSAYLCESCYSSMRAGKKREKIGNFFIDWSDFPETVDKFIKTYRARLDRGGFYLIPQREVVRFIMQEYDCTYPTAITKLKLLTDRRHDLEFIKIENPRQDVFSPKPVTKKYLKVTKRLHW